MKDYKPKTDEEIKQLAMDMVAGKIFSHWHIKEPKETMTVFMPIALGAFKDTTEEEINSIGLIYEYIDQASPRSVNGYPSFFSFKLLNKDDTKRLTEKMDKIEEALKAI